MRETLRMIIVLTVIGMVSGLVLSLTNSWTQPIIQDNLARRLQESVLEVLPGTKSVRSVELPAQSPSSDHPSPGADQKNKERVSMIIESLDESEEPVGFAFVTEESGYGGVLKVLVGVHVPEMKISSITILEHGETPGIGSRIEGAEFRDQFIGLTTNDPITLNRDIDNLTGATVSAKAVTDAVRLGLEIAVSAYEGGR